VIPRLTPAVVVCALLIAVAIHLLLGIDTVQNPPTR
jgi:hypothetical protein